MANDVMITVVGSVGGDVELKFTPAGKAVANFSLATSSRTFNKQTNEWEDGETTWFRVNVWQQMAEHVAESITKGMRVIVTGRLSVRQYERTDGTKGTSVEITADEVGPSLRYATANVVKAQRQQSGGQQSGRQPAQQQADPWSNPSANPWGNATEGAPPF